MGARFGFACISNTGKCYTCSCWTCVRNRTGRSNKYLCDRGWVARNAIDTNLRMDGDEGGNNQREAFRTPPSKSHRSAPKHRAAASGSMLARAARVAVDDEQMQTANKQVQQLQARADLVKDIRQSLADSTSGRSFYMILKKKVEASSAEQVAALELDPQACLTKHETEIIAPLQSWTSWHRSCLSRRWLRRRHFGTKW